MNCFFKSRKPAIFILHLFSDLSVPDLCVLTLTMFRNCLSVKFSVYNVFFSLYIYMISLVTRYFLLQTTQLLTVKIEITSNVFLEWIEV